MFVLTPNDPEDFAERFLARGPETGVASEEITVGQARAKKPRLNPLSNEFLFASKTAVAGDRAQAPAKEYGADIRPYHASPTSNCVIPRSGSHGAKRETGRHSVSAAASSSTVPPWAGDIATMIGACDVAVVPGRS